jgi:hypothetical protein
VKYDEVKKKMTLKRQFICDLAVAMLVLLSLQIFCGLFIYYDPQVKDSGYLLALFVAPLSMYLGIGVGKYLVYKHYVYKYDK